VVTSDFHMPRSRAIFEFCGRAAGATLWGDPLRFRLDFHAVSDEGAFPAEVRGAFGWQAVHCLSTGRSQPRV
jgi:hypothetical protein